MRPLALPKGLAERYHRGLAEDPRHRLAFVRFLVESLLARPLLFARPVVLLFGWLCVRLCTCMCVFWDVAMHAKSAATTLFDRPKSPPPKRLFT